MSGKNKTAPAAANGTAAAPKAAKGGAGAAAKKGGAATAKTTNGTSTPAAADDEKKDNGEEVQLTQYSTSSKPDREQYNTEQEKIKAQIAAKQAQLDKVRAKISDSTGAGGGPLGDRRKALRSEQNELRGKTAGHKTERNEVLGQLKQLQEGVQKKIKDINTAKSKTSYKSVAEIDGRIKDLERQVESGQMRLVEEKRALSEITDLRRSRKTFDSLTSSQESIDSSKSQIEELKSKLDNPEYKSLQGRYEEIQKELDEINQELDRNGQSRDKLFEERNKLQEEVNVLWGRKKDSAGAFKEANDRYYTKMNDERQKRIERQQTERRAYEDSKRAEINEKLLEEARLPAFGREIEDCTTLINYFSRFQGSGGNASASIPEPKLATVQSEGGNVGVPKLELRKVEDGMPEGAVMMKKKGEEEDNFFVGSKGKKGRGGNKKGGASGATGGEEKAKEKESGQTMNVPFQTVAALLQFNISAPLSRDDVPKTIEALKEKKTWYDANNDKVTKERIQAAEERIRKAEEKSGAAASSSEKTEDTPAAASVEEEEKTADAVEETAEGVGKMDVGEGGAATDGEEA